MFHGQHWYDKSWIHTFERIFVALPIIETSGFCWRSTFAADTIITGSQLWSDSVWPKNLFITRLLSRTKIRRFMMITRYITYDYRSIWRYDIIIAGWFGSQEYDCLKWIRQHCEGNVAKIGNWQLFAVNVQQCINNCLEFPQTLKWNNM